MFDKRISKVALCLLFIHIGATGYTAGESQDQTSSRTNTLFDDADDIQRQLDNEAKDRIKFGRPKTIWVFHFPTHFPEHNSLLGSLEEQLARSPREFGMSRQLIRSGRSTSSLYMAPAMELKMAFTTDPTISHSWDHRKYGKGRKLRYIDDTSTTNPATKNKTTLSNMADEEEESNNLMTPPLPPFRDWDYNNQGKWAKLFPDCAGKSQSPVDLPISGLIKSRGARNLLFQNYDVQPKTLTLMNDGKRVVLFGEWKSDQRPLIYGGAAHSRRYLFHSLTLHLPSEHTIGGLQYPLETQSLYVSAEYKDMDEALSGSPSDPQAFLAVSNLYKYSNHTHKGLDELLASAKNMGVRNGTIAVKPLSHFNPPFKEYACYQGSMTTPPCTESVLWLIRGRTLSIMRESVEAAQALLATDAEPRHLYFRNAQPLNDRKVYLFK